MQTLAAIEKEHIQNVLREVKWVVGGKEVAAAQLGIPRTTLLYRMRKLGIAQSKAMSAAASAL
jgi:transcriptional regulator with GAF, ATPase, and Fis domain